MHIVRTSGIAFLIHTWTGGWQSRCFLWLVCLLCHKDLCQCVPSRRTVKTNKINKQDFFFKKKTKIPVSDECTCIMATSLAPSPIAQQTFLEWSMIVFTTAAFCQGHVRQQIIAFALSANSWDVSSCGVLTKLHKRDPCDVLWHTQLSRTHRRLLQLLLTWKIESNGNSGVLTSASLIALCSSSLHFSGLSLVMFAIL